MSFPGGSQLLRGPERFLLAMLFAGPLATGRYCTQLDRSQIRHWATSGRVLHDTWLWPLADGQRLPPPPAPIMNDGSTVFWTVRRAVPWGKFHI